MTRFTLTLSVCAPLALQECANHLAAYLGGSEADLNTYVSFRWLREDVRYCYLATVITPDTLPRVQTPSDVPEFVNPALLMQALQALVVVNAAEGGPLPLAQPDKIVAIVGADNAQAYMAFDLTLVPDAE